MLEVEIFPLCYVVFFGAVEIFLVGVCVICVVYSIKVVEKLQWRHKKRYSSYQIVPVYKFLSLLLCIQFLVLMKQHNVQTNV